MHTTGSKVAHGYRVAVVAFRDVQRSGRRVSRPHVARCGCAGNSDTCTRRMCVTCAAQICPVSLSMPHSSDLASDRDQSGRVTVCLETRGPFLLAPLLVTVPAALHRTAVPARFAMGLVESVVATACVAVVSSLVALVVAGTAPRTATRESIEDARKQMGLDATRINWGVRAHIGCTRVGCPPLTCPCRPHTPIHCTRTSWQRTGNRGHRSRYVCRAATRGCS